MADEKLAIDGGTPVRSGGFPSGSKVGKEELEQLGEVIESGNMFYASGTKVKGFAEEFAALVKEIEAEKTRLEAEAEKKRLEEVAAKEKAEREALLEGARAALDGAAALLAEKKFDEARSALEGSAARIEEVGLEEEREELAKRIDAAEKAEADRVAREKQEETEKEGQKKEAERSAAEAARQSQFAECVALGDRRFAERDFKGALDAYQSAAELKSTPELERRIEDCRFEAAVARGKAAQDREELALAAEWYRKALAVREDAPVRARLMGVLDLLRKRELGVLLAEVRGVDPEKATNEDEIKKAIEAAKRAIELAGEKEIAELEAHAEGLQRALKHRIAIEQARAAAAVSEWRKAKKAAVNALSFRPRDLEASGILARAELELGRPKGATSAIGMDFVWVPGGESRMGSDAADPDERPVHTVRLKGFYIGLTEVTNAQYEKFDPRHAKRRSKYAKGPNDPVVNVSWRAAVAFCEWLFRREGKRYRLPTEAEWEYAARGKTDRIYPWGDDLPGHGPGDGAKDAPSGAGTFRANFGQGESKSVWKRDGFVYVAPVGSFPAGASPFGCLDMAGNVWEWCSDWYGPYRVSLGAVENPTGPSSGTERVIRGGSWYHDASSLRATNRWSKKPNNMSLSTGFRVVMEAE